MRAASAHVLVAVASIVALGACRREPPPPVQLTAAQVPGPSTAARQSREDEAPAATDEAIAGAPSATPTHGPPAAAPLASPAATRDTPPPSPSDAGVLRACAIPDVRFGAGSATLDEDDVDALTKLAGCLDEDAWKSRRLTVIGLADPSGSSSANLQLGEERAAAVMRVLVDHGVAASRIGSGSAGATVATADPARRAADERRVEIFIAP